MLRSISSLLAILIFGLSAGLSQTTSAPASPPKPLRERLLERALKGDVEAQFDLAKGYEGGRFGLTQDVVQAHHWYQEAALQGDAFAEATLGIFYGFGKGVERNNVLAYIWLERSASHLTGSDRDSVTDLLDSIKLRMTPAQLERARDVAFARKITSKP